MTNKFGFTKMTLPEFELWLTNLKVARTVTKIQQHHTYMPAYVHFNGNNHFDRQLAMKNYHINHNGWADIGQHFTIFPDGSILTGRSVEKSPACITGQNAHSICIENFGNFDLNGDVMNQAQKDAIVGVTAALCQKFNLSANSNSIVYHHWFDLSTGARNNGTKNNKSCPGTNFFGGNKVADCETHFLPLVQARLGILPVNTVTSVVQPILKYVCVMASSLNIRTRPDAASAKATDREAAALGAILRVYEEQNGWYRISSTSAHWVAGKHTMVVQKATVNATTLNVRSGPGPSFPKTGTFSKGEEVFIISEQNGWSQVSMDDRWVSKSFLS